MAGGVLLPKDDAGRAHNAACKRAADIVKAYARGEGLFQVQSYTMKRQDWLMVGLFLALLLGAVYIGW